MPRAQSFGGQITWDAIATQTGAAIPVTREVAPSSNLGVVIWTRSDVGVYFIESASFELHPYKTRMIVSGYNYAQQARIVTAYAEGWGIIEVFDAAGVHADLGGALNVSIVHWA